MGYTPFVKQGAVQIPTKRMDLHKYWGRSHLQFHSNGYANFSAKGARNPVRIIKAPALPYSMKVLMEGVLATRAHAGFLKGVGRLVTIRAVFPFLGPAGYGF